MKTGISVFFFTLFISYNTYCQSANFTAPDTVCVNETFNVINTSSGATSYYWNFCTADINTVPVGYNFGNLGSFSAPVYIDYVFENGNYYGFMTNNWPGSLLRLNFGNNLLNTPTVTNLGTIGGIVPGNTEGIQVIKNEGKWYLIIVGGDITGGNAPRVVKIELGTNIANNSPTGVNWGNLGNMSYPHDLYVFDDNGHWYGLTVNTTNNTVTRFDFTTSFSNTPTGVNLGNIGNLDGPTGLHAFKDNNNWYAFITNAWSHTITRLDFGNSLLNTPVGTNLGNIGNTFSTPWDIYIMKYCGESIAFLINAGGNDLVKLDFNNDIESIPSVFSYGNVGDLSFPHCLSKIFRVGPDLYTFIPNVNNNTLSRVRFTGCSSSSIPSTTLQNPPAISYSETGIYNINLSIDDGLATQDAYCKQVVVLEKPQISPIPDMSICAGNVIQLDAGITNATNITWAPETGLSDPTISNPLAYPDITTQYIVTASNGGECFVVDTVMVFVNSVAQCNSTEVNIGFDIPDTVCVGTQVNITNTSVNASSFYWSFCTGGANQVPDGVNLGNISSELSAPVYIDYVYDGGNYFGFMTNNWPGGLLRLDFGPSLLNTPTITDLGTVGGIVPGNTEGIQIIRNNNSWYLVIVGGDQAGGNQPRLVTISLGNNIANNAPVGVNWGNIGSMSYPHDLYVFENFGRWFGFTLNTSNNSITRFDFSDNLANAPTAINFGNLGGFNGPTGMHVVEDNGNWMVFVTNAWDHSLTKLDFGSSLLNLPVGTNLGTLGGALNVPWDIYMINECGLKTALVANSGTNSLLKLDFGNNLNSIPTVSSLGNLGDLSFPHSISKTFRVGSSLYTFVPNVNNHSITRIKIEGCTSSFIPESNLQNPDPVVFNTPGNYTIKLVIDEGLPTQKALCKQLVVIESLPSGPLQEIAICADSIRIGSTSSDSYLWNTGDESDSITISLPGIYWVETNSNGCKSRDSFNVSLSTMPNADFGFKQEMCSPLNLNFFSAYEPGSSVQWHFGNGQSANTHSAIVSYDSYGNYEVKLILQNSSGCVDSISKMISVNNQENTGLLFNSDTTICLGDSILLIPSSTFLNYCWQSTESIAPDSLYEYVSPSGPVVYTFTTQVPEGNLVTNNDFESGNTGFQSELPYVFPQTSSNQFWVGQSPAAWNPLLNSCNDHTSGSGNMMIVNSSSDTSIIWSQTLMVQPYTDYLFSLWLLSLESTSDLNLDFLINGVNIGDSIHPENSSNCQWFNRFVTWNSGEITSVTISVQVSSTSSSFYALDDIEFSSVQTRFETLSVNLDGLCDSININGVNRICSITDTVTYSIYKAPGCSQDFNVEVDDAFAEVISQSADELQLKFKQNGTTAIKVYYQNNCKLVIDSLQVDIKISPGELLLGDNIDNCRDTIMILNAGDGYESYLWQNGSNLPTFEVFQPGIFHVQAQDFCGEVFIDTFIYTRHEPIPFGAFPADVTICTGDSVRFNAQGGTKYHWKPELKFANPYLPVSMAVVNESENFSVQIIDEFCFRDTLIIIPVQASSSAVIEVTKSNDVSCGNDSAVLIVSGASNYTWSPDLYITRELYDRITVKPPIGITYYVTGVNDLGCEGVDSVTVHFLKEGDQKIYVPTAFTPNGDGLNDVFKPIFIGPSKKYNLRIYNRWGELVFQTSDPLFGWNGIYKSRLQPIGVFVYYLTAEGGCNGRFVKKGTFVLAK